MSGNIKAGKLIYKIFFIVLLSFALLVVFAVDEAKAADPEETSITVDSNFVLNQILVKFKSRVNESQRAMLMDQAGLDKILDTIGPREKKDVYLYSLKPGQTVTNAIQLLKDSGKVIFAEANQFYKASFIPNDPLFDPYQWGLYNYGQDIYGVNGLVDADIDAPEGWDILNCCSNLTVAVIDSGIDPSHPELKNKRWVNWGEISGNSIDDDGNGYVDDEGGYNFAGISMRDLDTFNLGPALFIWGWKFGIANSTQFVQRIQGTGRPLSAIGLFLWKKNAPTYDIRVSLKDALNGLPLAVFIIPSSAITTTPSEYYYTFPQTLPLNDGVSYYIVAETLGQNQSNYYAIAPNTPQFGSSYTPDPYREGEVWYNNSKIPLADLFFHTNANSVPHDDNGHGTHVSGIIGATTNNLIGVAGASRKTKIMPVKALDSAGFGTSAEIADAIYYATNNDADVINMSLGGDSYSKAVDDAVQYANANHVTIFAAVGNDGNATLKYPANYPNVIGVGATTNKDSHAPFSNFNTSVDLSAPGQEVYSTLPIYNVAANSAGSSNNYDYMTGTSMASPLAAAVAAEALTEKRDMLPSDVLAVMTNPSNVADLGIVGWDPLFGAGRINLENVMRDLDDDLTDSYNWLKQWDNPGLAQPTAVAVADSYNQEWRDMWGANQLNKPNGVAVDANDYIYVADTFNNRIIKFSSGGVYIGSWGTQGNGNSQFKTPRDVAVKDGKVYVTDYGNHRVQVFDAITFNHIATWGSYGSGRGKFNLPFGIAVDPATGEIYVTDINQTVSKIQPYIDTGGAYKANFVARWGSFGGGDGEFQNPMGIAVDHWGYVYVADHDNYRIQKFQPDGSYVDQWAMGPSLKPQAVDVDRAGNLYAADMDNHVIRKFNTDGGFISQWGKAGGAAGTFNGPHGIAVNSFGEIFIADTFNNRIQKYFQDGRSVMYVADRDNHRIIKYNKGGSLLLQWGKKGIGNGDFDRPEGVAVDSQGNVYVADSGNYRVQKFDSNGTFIPWNNAVLKFTNGITIDPRTDDVYVTDVDKVRKFSSAGVLLNQWGQLGAGLGDFDHPRDIAVDNCGYVYVADRGNNRVQKFDSNGTFKTAWSTPQPWGIDADLRGGVYVTDETNHTINKFSTNGVPVPVTGWGGSGSGNGTFNALRGIAVDYQGRVFVADTFNDLIQKFEPSSQWSATYFKLGNTPAGMGEATVTVPLSDRLSVSFTDVTSDGETSATSDSTPVGGPPAGIKFISDQFQINTDAGFTAPVRVQIAYDENEVTDESAVRIYRWTGSKWENKTVDVDEENNVVIGEANSFSTWIAGGPLAPPTGVNNNFLIAIGLFVTIGGLLTLRRRFFSTLLYDRRSEFNFF